MFTASLLALFKMLFALFCLTLVSNDTPVMMKGDDPESKTGVPSMLAVFLSLGVGLLFILLSTLYLCIKDPPEDNGCFTQLVSSEAGQTN